MALKKLLSSTSEPYGIRAPVVLKMVEARETVRVTQWAFDQDKAVGVVVKKNILVAATDGDSATRFVLFEEQAGKVKAGQTYIVRNYRVGRSGGTTSLQCWRDTRFYETAPLLVSEELVAKCHLLLFPPSLPVSIQDLDGQAGGLSGLITVTGKIVSVSSYSDW